MTEKIRIHHDDLFKHIVIRFCHGYFTDFVLPDREYYNFHSNSLEGLWKQFDSWCIDSDVFVVSDNK